MNHSLSNFPKVQRNLENSGQKISTKLLFRSSNVEKKYEIIIPREAIIIKKNEKKITKGKTTPTKSDELLEIFQIGLIFETSITILTIENLNS